MRAQSPIATAPSATTDGRITELHLWAVRPFGTIKRMTAGGRFLTKGITKVRGEAALSILAYNILRAINLIGPFALRARLA